MKCELCISREKGSEISEVIDFKSTFDLLITFYGFIKSMEKSGWKLEGYVVSNEKEIRYSLKKNDASVVISLKKID